MSGFIGQSVMGGLSFDGWATRSDDDRARSEFYRADVELVPIGYEEALGTFRSPWWPGASGLGAVFDGTDVVVPPPAWSRYDINTGAVSRYGMTGVTRDQFGTPLGGCTVKLYRTNTDEVVSSMTSDSAGNYLVTTPYYPDRHYIVIYRAGFPDVYGTTVNTIIGA
jgi:hypothetical protein